VSGVVAVVMLAVAAAGLAVTVSSARARSAPYMVHISVARKTNPISQDLYLSRPLLTEALARLAKSLDAHLLYNASPNGGWSYVEIAGSRIDLAGNWLIRVNGQIVNDLSTISLKRGDIIRLEQPS
jgi:hypothetical protein